MKCKSDIVRLPSTAESLISVLIKRYGLVDRGGDFIDTEHSDFDLLIVHEVDDFKEVFAHKGKAVIHVRYHGYAHIDLIIGATAEKITSISN